MPIRKTTVKAYLRSKSEYMKYPLPSFGGLQTTLGRLQAGSSYSLSGGAGVDKALVSQSFNSVSTPGYYVKKKVNILWVPKKHPLVPPSSPRFNPPKLPSFRPRVGEKPKQTARRYARYLALKSRIIAARAAYITRYNVALARYKKRLARYEHYLRLSKEGYISYRRVRSTEKTLVRNPYSSVIDYDHGVVGFYNEEINSSSPYSLVSAPGPYCYYHGCSIYMGYPYTWSFPADPAFSTCAYSAASSRATQKIFKSLNSQDLHIGNIIAERAQTFAMLADIMKKIVALKSNPLQFLSSILGNLPKEAANATLMYNFGLKPLIQDAYGAVQALNRLSASQQTDRIFVRCGASATGFDRAVISTSDNTREIDFVEVVKVNFSLEYKVVNSATSNLQMLGLLNPAEIAWEAMPWSFVVDWFLPIGNYINSLSADAGLEFVGGTRTIVTKQTYNTVATYPDQRSDLNKRRHTVGILKGSRSRETKVRTVLTSAPTPVLPSFKNPLSATHVAEALSLLVQRLR